MHSLFISFARLRQLLRVDGHGMVLDRRDMGRFERLIYQETDLFGTVFEGTRAMGALLRFFGEMPQVEEGRLVDFS